MARTFASTLAALLLSCLASAQPVSSDLPEAYRQAYARGSRSASGKPGPAYFQNRARYRLQTEILPDSGRLEGSADIVYYNQSPDTLREIVLRTYQDYFREGAERNLPLAPKYATQGFEVSAAAFNGEEILSSPAWRRQGTNAFIRPDKPLLPGDSCRITLRWGFDIPKNGSMRMGTYGSHTYFIAYWYPQVSVYDDVFGWDTYDFLGLQEFYNDFSDFEVVITAPRNHLIWATGELENAPDILAPEILARYLQAWESDSVVRIVTEADLERGTALTGPAERHTWRFRAQGVPDFAFAVSNRYLWDGCSASPEAGKPRILTDACYAPNAKDFPLVAGFAREIVLDLSLRMPAVRFPYPKITVFHGESGSGGMEYPMMVNNQSSFNAGSAFDLAYHEIAHTYFPFYMGINERRFTFMDEGWATFFPLDPVRERGYMKNPLGWGMNSYLRLAAAGEEEALMNNFMEMRNVSAYLNAAYTKPGTAYYILKDLLGDSLFRVCLQGYMRDWNGKHPLPFDFFNSFNHYAGQDLSWFWRPWFFETRVPDLQIGEARIQGKSVELRVDNPGQLPLPVHFEALLKDGEKVELHYPASVWKENASSFQVAHSFGQAVESLTMGAWFAPDVDKGNNSASGKKKKQKKDKS